MVYHTLEFTAKQTATGGLAPFSLNLRAYAIGVTPSRFKMLPDPLCNQPQHECLLLPVLSGHCSFDPGLLQQQVAAAQAVGPDLVVVMIHWGPNWRWQPSKQLRRLGKAILDAGADLVFGTIPHHIQVQSCGVSSVNYNQHKYI